MHTNSSKFPGVFHVGCMKTGTTTLQNLWKNDPRLNLILHSRYFNTEKYNTAFDYIKQYQCGQGLIDLESDENISRTTKSMLGLDTSIQRIYKANPKAKIVLTVRNQKGMLLSMYKHVIRQTSKNYTPDEFINSEEGQSFIDTIKYDSLVERILKFFPKEQILIYRWEDFKSNPEDFLNEFYKQVFELEYDNTIKYKTANVGRNDSQIYWKRKINGLKWSPSKAKYLYFLAKAYNTILEKVFLKVIYRLVKNKTKKVYTWNSFGARPQLEADFHRSNQRFEEIYGLDLEYTF